MTTQESYRTLRQRRAIAMMVATLLMLIASVRLAAAQTRESSDRDNPVRLTSGDISSQIAPGRDAFYNFAAGPGVLTMTLDVSETAGPAQVDVYLFDRDAKQIGYEHWFSAGAVRSDRKIEQVNFPRRQQVLMKISTSYVSDNSPGRFRLRLAGAIELAQPATVVSDGTRLPNRGVLRIDMNDGTVQEIELTRVRQVSIRP